MTTTFGLRGAMGGSDRRGSQRDGGVAPPKKTGLAGQASGNWIRRAGLALAAIGLPLCLAACGGHANEGKDCPPAARTNTVSGFCVPRYVSLKRAKVSARKGPGVDYPALWIYSAKGLPVQVVAETLDWRRICDPDSGAVWVHRSMVDGRRTVMATGHAPMALRRSADDGAKVLGALEPRALADLEKCQGDWCRVAVAGVRGWTRAEGLWGVAPAAQCR